MVSTGYRQYLYFGNESRYGSAAVINQPIGLVQSINPTEKNTTIKVRTLGGNRDYAAIVPGKFDISGNFEYFLQGGAFLRMGMSEDTGTSVAVDSGPKVHTGASRLHIMGSAASPLANSFPSFTLEFSDAEDAGTSATSINLKRKYTGARVNSMTISGSVDEPVRVAVDWVAQGVTVSSAVQTTVTEYTTEPLVFYQGQLYATSVAITAYTQPGTAAELGEVKSFDFTVNNNLESSWYVAGTTNVYQTLRGLKSLIPKGRDYEGTINMDFKNTKQYRRFLGSNTASAGGGSLNRYQIALDFVRTGTLGGTPKLATDDWVRIVLASCAFEDINIPGAPEDIVTQNVGLQIKKAKVYCVDADLLYTS